MKQRIFLFLIALCSCVLVYAQGTLGEYPGTATSVGFDATCGYLDAGTVPVADANTSLAGPCGTWDDSVDPIFDTGTGFDVPVGLYNWAWEAGYALRVQWIQQFGCCGVCLDAVVDFGINGCASGGQDPDLSLYGYPTPALWGADVFGGDLISYADLCPNMEYFVLYQTLTTQDTELDDPDGNFCGLDDTVIDNFGSSGTATIVAPGTRDPLTINTASLAVSGAVDCAATDVLMDFSADIVAGCTWSLGTCSMGLEFEFRAVLADCPNAGETLTIASGPVVNDPTACVVGGAFGGQILLSLGDICAALECDPAAQLELYTTYTACEADDIVGDGSGNDEAVMMLGDLATLLADAQACCTPAVCDFVYDFSADPICTGAAPTFVVDPATCTVGALDPFGLELDLDFYVYTDPATGFPAQAPAGYDPMGGATVINTFPITTPELVNIGGVGGTWNGTICADLVGPALTAATCAPETVSFFIIPWDRDYDTDGDGTFGEYNQEPADSPCPIQQVDVVVNPIFEVIEDQTNGCNPFAGVFVSDGAGGIFDQDGDGALTTADACGFDELAADCVDGTTLDYDYTALDVGMCSPGPLTGTLTCVCPAAACASTYSYTGPTEVCNGDAIDFTIDAATCNISLNQVDFGAGTGVGPSLDLDLYIYVPGGVPSVAPAGTTVIPADIDGGATGNADIAYIGTASDGGTGPGGGCGDLSFAAGQFLNGTCAPITVTFFVVPYSYDYDTDGDGTFGAYLADGNTEACPVLQYDVVINPILEVIEDTSIGCDPLAGAFISDGMGGFFDVDGDGALTFADACQTAQLTPTADCTDGATLDYDFSALDVGMCSAPLTGTLTCVCPPGVCEPYNSITVAAGCNVFDICIGYIDVDQDGLSDVGGADPTGTIMTVDFGGSTGGTFVNDGLFAYDGDGDGVADATGYCVTYVYDAQGCAPEPYSGLVTLTCPDGSSGTLDLGAGPITLTAADVVGDVFGVPGGGAFYPVLTQGNAVAPVCPTVTGMTGTPASVDIVAPDGTVCTTITGEAPACDATGGNAAEPVQLNPIADPLLGALLGAGTFACTIDETADLSYTCGACTDPSVPGCTDPCAPNYDPMADMDDGSCQPYDMTCNTDCNAGPFGGTWDAATCACINETTPVPGCTDATADNYDPAANCDDGSCMTAPPCAISAAVTSMCDDNGTPEDDSDDITTYTITVSGTNAGATFSDDQGNAGVAYGTALTYTAMGTAGLSVVFTDDTDATCTTSVNQSSGCATVENIPTVGEWGLIILGLLMSITAIVGIRQRREEEATA